MLDRVSVPTETPPSAVRELRKVLAYDTEVEAFPKPPRPRHLPTPSVRHTVRITGKYRVTPTTWETGMSTQPSGTDPRRATFRSPKELAERLEGYIERRASGRIRDLHV